MTEQRIDPETRRRKRQLRARFRTFRQDIQESDYQDRCDAICEVLKVMPVIALATVVHVYYPARERREIDIRPVIDVCLARGQTIVMPCAPAAREARALIHRTYNPSQPLSRNRWDLLEPVEGRQVPVSEIEVAIVPALAADDDLYRLGYGGGFYDDFIMRADLVAICPAFDETLVTRLPREPHDTPVEIVVTETEMLRRAPL